MFDLARSTAHHHLIPQTVDLALSPPDGYFFITDFLIYTCALLYTLCYFFYMIRTYSDRFLAGSVLFLSQTMAYELYYAWVCTTATWQRVGFGVWFLFDVSFVAVALRRAYAREERARMVGWLVLLTGVGIAFLWKVGQLWPDEREQLTAFWTGVYLELPIGWGQLYYLVKRGDTKGQSLEIWITRYLGCICAFAVFGWRYVNVPQNWAYVGSFWSVAGMIVTLIPETIYPFVYVWAHKKERAGKDKDE